MERLPEQAILEFHPDTFQYVRRELGLDKPGQMDAAIDLLDDWVRKQAHFTEKNFSREYLERTIILDKGSVERAKVQLDRLFTMRTAMPDFFERVDAKNDFENVHEIYVDALLPKLTKDHYRIYAGKIRKDGVTSRSFKIACEHGGLILENIRASDYCSGFIGILDYRFINIIDFVAQINLFELNQFISLITEGHQLRVKGIHVLTTSRTIEIVMRIFKQVFSKKIGNRIQVHMTLDTLYESVPKDLLPEEFGGELKSLVEYSNDWREYYGTKEYIDYIKAMNKAGVNENLRNGTNKNKNELLGISGSFKTLCVD